MASFSKHSATLTGGQQSYSHDCIRNAKRVSDQRDLVVREEENENEGHSLLYKL